MSLRTQIKGLRKAETGIAAACAVQLSSLSGALAGSRPGAKGFPYSLPESLSLLGSHVAVALGHATPEIRVPATVESKSTEEDAAERKQSNRLPERNQAPAEQRR